MSQSGSIWVDGIEPSRRLIALGFAVALTIAALDITLDGRLGIFFDVGFALLALALALAARPGEFFTASVLPPVVMGGVIAMLAIVDPGSLARDDDDVVQAVATGLVQHSAALVVGYLLCLTTLWARQHARHATLLD